MNLDKTLLKVWEISKPQTVTKFNNSNCDKTQQLKLWQNSKTQILIKRTISDNWQLMRCIRGSHLRSCNVFFGIFRFSLFKLWSRISTCTLAHNQSRPCISCSKIGRCRIIWCRMGRWGRMPRVYNRKRCGAEGTTVGGGVGFLVEDAFW